MRVAQLVHGLGVGGAQKVIAALVRGRRDETLRHVVYTPTDGVMRREIEDAGALVRVVPRRLPRLDPFWVYRLGRAFARDRIDLVHGHLFGDSLHGALAARGRPLVLTLHTGPGGLPPLQLWGYRRLLPRAARVAACSGAVASAFAALEPGVAIETITNGIEPPAPAAPSPERRAALRRELGAGPDDVLCAAIGRLAEQKAHHHLLDAVALVDEPRLRLAIVGDGPLRGALETRARELGVVDRVTFTGFRDDVAELRTAIDVVVFSSVEEGLPVALLEAMAAGLPVVTTDVPGIVEAARADREALVVARAAPDRLAAALARITAEPDLRRDLGRAAARRFRERYTADVMVARYETLYREVATASA